MVMLAGAIAVDGLAGMVGCPECKMIDSLESNRVANTATTAPLPSFHRI